ncbi:MAG: hypothetical protein ABI986_01850 [Chloroflexota bacterium]
MTYHRDGLFGEIVDKEMILSNFGKIADECWCVIPEYFPNVELGTYVVMPNHMPGIIVIHNGESAATGITIDDGRRDAALLRPYDDNNNPHKINVKPASLGAIITNT